MIMPESLLHVSHSDVTMMGSMMGTMTMTMSPFPCSKTDLTRMMARNGMYLQDYPSSHRGYHSIVTLGFHLTTAMLMAMNVVL